MLKVEPEEQTTSSFGRLNEVTTVSKYFALILFVLLPFLGFYLGFQYGYELGDSTPRESARSATDSALTDTRSVHTAPPTDTAMQTSSPEDVSDQSVVDDDDWFRSDRANIAFEVTKGWQLATSLPRLPEGVADPDFVFENTQTKCFLASTNFDYFVTAETYIDANFTDRSADIQNISSLDLKLDAHKYVYQNSGVDEEEQPFFADELSIYTHRTLQLVVWQLGGAQISSECTTAVRELLKSATYHFNMADLTEQSRGILYIQKKWLRDTHDNPIHMTYTDNATQKTYTLGEIPGIQWAGRYIVANDRIYAPVNKDTKHLGDDAQSTTSSNIAVIDPLAGSIEMLFSDDIPDAYISSIYIRGNTMYLLMGNDMSRYCLDGYRPCDLDLYAYDMERRKLTLLQEALASSRIYGYGENEDALYLVHITGDAGCWGGVAERYADGAITVLREAWGCSGDPGYESPSVIYDALDSNVMSHEETKFVMLENGGLKPPVNEFDLHKSYSTFLFVE